MMQAKTLIAAFIGLVLSSAAVFAQTPTLLKQHKDWAAYTHASGSGKVCYALTKPTQMLPGDRNHGDVFFFVSSRPSEGVTAEPSLLVGYPLKEGSTVTVNIDGKTFNLFTKNDGAWVENAATEAQLIAAMKAGREMSVSGQSGRGTQTSYKFSLAGVTAAINTAGAACR
ncbi:invasion associated locus B family protein [Roseibium algae]|uniref:Invasion associated locus B family protein n=1 Tax=Roseibium algae TaxID=3123038 RepID=A0ABU8TNR2_9HYPH